MSMVLSHTVACQLSQDRILHGPRSDRKLCTTGGATARFREGERVFLFKPAEKSGQARKFARPFHGPYRVVEVDSNTAKICRVDKPDEEPILVALERLRRCPEEIGDECWPPARITGRARTKRVVSDPRELMPPQLEQTPQLTNQSLGTEPDHADVEILRERQVRIPAGEDTTSETSYAGLELEDTHGQTDSPDQDSLPESREEIEKSTAEGDGVKLTVEKGCSERSASLEAVGATLGVAPRSEQVLTEPPPSHVILG